MTTPLPLDYLQAIIGHEERARTALALELASIHGHRTKIRAAARRLIYEASHITGWPRCGQGIDTLTIGTEVCTALLSRSHDPDGYPHRRISFPTRWLSLPEAEWKAELYAIHKAHEERKHQELIAAWQQRQAEERAKIDARERAEYERLRAKFAGFDE